MSDEVTQKHINAEIVSAGDVDYRQETHHHYTVTDYSELDTLINKFEQDQKGDQENKSLIDELLHLSTPKANEKIIGLGLVNTNGHEVGLLVFFAHGTDRKPISTHS